MTLPLDEKVLAIHRALARARIPHAFGGALALAYYATPRGTIDIGVNVFVRAVGAPRVLRALAPSVSRRAARTASPRSASAA
jgi:hypothetical protein